MEFDEPQCDFRVLMHLLPCLANGEVDVLTNEEFNQYQEFVAEFGDHFYPVVNPEYPGDWIQYMAKCDITGKIGLCVEIVKG